MNVQYVFFPDSFSIRGNTSPSINNFSANRYQISISECYFRSIHGRKFFLKNISRLVPLKILVWCWVISVWEHRANSESCGNASTRLGGTTNPILSLSVFHSASRWSTSDSIRPLLGPLDCERTHFVTKKCCGVYPTLQNARSQFQTKHKPFRRKKIVKFLHHPPKWNAWSHTSGLPQVSKP